MSHSQEKNLGRPHLLEEGQDIELGQPLINESPKEIEIKFQGFGLMLEDALGEFMAYLAEKHELPSKVYIEDISKTLKEDLKKKDILIPLALIEAVQLALEKIGNRVEEKKESGDMPDETDMDNSEMARLYKKGYQEAEDFFFSHSELFDAMPDRADIIEWFKDEKRHIEETAKNAELENEQKRYESRLKAEVPAINNFIDGREAKGDYDTILSILDDKILYAREEITILLKVYIQGLRSEEKEEIEGQLRFIYVMRSFMALIEGERNEKIALKQ
ncbi:MAG: hypothetical protein A3G49_00050 [Candidatus Sungbacteria bacterium RIFCSPLOWO2_12_FULL_41_11]|uniref:Uncharacterized protein n=1 Tax=Candidatus Sungbacteria bacterium RIFCSPLOWO2_12_FULL_41_11 TaxID=1802286 RepID=A0A1G2LM38_9BACT|nr:MAG: hypothetical protein UV01_C0005G0019 [Parcubacteria group bacterium GW2011_GWA2_42_14]OGZ99767.1 MAG: hypothetical protein A3D41_04355 [Candidatus Sungbacteria bacterium RIFCSPHIGHO2_02_FULL_41_12b]OHA12653.1 MAG: hypothetical protein A3G49_00050 [Candidatus Sungbacteria bacterium RIFCSPLOWO2_12_FULL_41_11]